ncbi:MAG: hypothetical protein MN733_34110 [Nitrososphaera sp.]|nr:hypothetical protein [Nitrososphaera sp.]
MRGSKSSTKAFDLIPLIVYLARRAKQGHSLALALSLREKGLPHLLKSVCIAVGFSGVVNAPAFTTSAAMMC